MGNKTFRISGNAGAVCSNSTMSCLPTAIPHGCSAHPDALKFSGNHTDHQRGCVVAASINLDMIAAAAKNDCNCVRIKSEGFDFQQVDLSDLSVHPDEVNTTPALIRGIAAIFREKGYASGGVDLCVSSEVLRGSGLSSSAAFEVLIGTVFSCLYNDNALSPVLIAQIGQQAENRYFGKPCGLMDEMACSVGGFVSIDFYDPQHPIVERSELDLAALGYSMYIVDVKGDHSDLTAEYAAIPAEMKSVAAYFGKEYLRQLPAEIFYENLAEVRQHTSDRAVIRAHHFFTENLACAGNFPGAQGKGRGALPQAVLPVGSLVLCLFAEHLPQLFPSLPACQRCADGCRASSGRSWRLPYPRRRLRRYHPGVCS